MRRTLATVTMASEISGNSSQSWERRRHQSKPGDWQPRGNKS